MPVHACFAAKCRQIGGGIRFAAVGPAHVKRKCEPVQAYVHGGLCVLGFRPKEDPHPASFPETVYTFYSRDVVRNLLFDVGFANIDLSEPLPGLVLARAVKS